MGHMFISYSHKDSEYAHKLAETLQVDGFSVWIDARIDYGSQWPIEIQKQLDSCDAFIVIMTPRAFASDWVQSELQRAKRKSKLIFPMLLEGDEPWLSVESTQFYDVRDGKLPDLKFYSALRRSVSVGQKDTTLGFKRKKDGFAPPAETGKTKIKTEILVALIGAAVTLFTACATIISGPIVERWLNASRVPEVESLDSTNEPIADSKPAGTASDGVQMAFIPAGEFIMGGVGDEPYAQCLQYITKCGNVSWYEDIEPVHAISLSAYYIDVYETTNAQYAECVEDSACQPPVDTGSVTRFRYYGNPEYDHYPVIHVSWDMAQGYCEWRGARLPTEAEWEKAARGEDQRIYPWGNDADTDNANYNGAIGDTSETGNYESGKSPYGLYDMAGNVWEWTSDWYLDTYYNESPGQDPLGPNFGEQKVLRGGSWYDSPHLIRVTTRLNQPNPVDNNFGFRCARSE